MATSKTAKRSSSHKRHSTGAAFNRINSKNKQRLAERREPVLAGATMTTLEFLENRQLMAVVNVADFGAIANDGRSDAAAIRAAMNAAGTGGTVNFGAGVFDTGGEEIVLASSRSYVGSNTTLRGVGPRGPQAHITGDNVTVKGFTFQGGGLFIDRPGGEWNYNINVDNNVFRMDAPGKQERAGLTWTSGLRDSKVTNNYFTGQSYSIWGYNGNNLLIANNEIVSAAYGIKVSGFRGDNNNITVEQNYIADTWNMGMEFQWRFNNLIIQDNFYEKPRLFTEFARNNNTFA
jgi:hypothetical protein